MSRHRLLGVLVGALLIAALAAGYVLWSRSQQQARARSATQPSVVPSASGSPAADSAALGPGRIAFRNTSLGPTYGAVASVETANPSGPRTMTTTHCERVFATSARVLCLASRAGIVTTYTARAWPVADPSAATPLPLSGIPSRARLSRDGSHSATTSFVSGDSYAAANFSTRTVVTDLDDGTSLDLETFTLVDTGVPIAPIERNYWGVTFHADDDTFYVTVAFGGQTHLARGSLRERRIDTMRTDAECPSLSPDQTRVAYKKREDRPAGDWRIVVLDLATGVETHVAENRSVDDQVEWLDDETIIYGMPGEGTDAAQTNVWAVPSDGSGASRILIEKAWSPVVIDPRN